MSYVITTKGWSVGYRGKTLIGDMSISIEEGSIVTLIGPNGSGKSTILMSLTRQLDDLGGTVYIGEHELHTMSPRELAKETSVVFTGRIRPELMTCYDVVAAGRYPHTGYFGTLGHEDKKKVKDAMALFHITDDASREFASLSDGQKQRVLLARAVCQEPKILVLDEPTSFLDIRYKLELFDILRYLSREKHMTVLLSMHEVDLAAEIADDVLCVGEGHQIIWGKAHEIFRRDVLKELFSLDDAMYDSYFLGVKGRRRFSEKNDKGRPGQALPADGKKAHVLMVQGTMSNAGKSLLVAALCRILHRNGYRVAPFKSQNMALNSYVTADGLEMGRAQVMQAEAAGIAPDVCMNPILLKPTSHTGSQVMVRGRVLDNMDAREYFTYKKQLVPVILDAYHRLKQKADVIIIEGAGSPAEINLRENDIVNMGLAELVDAPVLLVGDIDRGGVFAQLLGTLELLEEGERARIGGLVINKFRGDKTILDPGIAMLEERAGIPVVGVLPFMELLLEDEDSLSPRFEKNKRGRLDIVVIRYPRISNFTDMNVFSQKEEVSVRYVTRPQQLGEPDFLILPGSKNTMGDLQWLRAQGWEEVILSEAKKGTPIWGICGGFQMLGCLIIDAQGVEEEGKQEGLSLLPVETVITEEKVQKQVAGTLPALEGCFASLTGAPYSGYEIHMGQSERLCEAEVKELPVVFSQKNVYGTYVHGIFDTAEIAEGVLQSLAKRKGLALSATGWKSYRAIKEREYDRLADMVQSHMDMDAVYRMLGL